MISTDAGYSTVRYINRETTPSFGLTVVANNSMSPHPLWSSVSVVVTILDLSTHPSGDVVTNVDVPEVYPVGPLCSISQPLMEMKGWLATYGMMLSMATRMCVPVGPSTGLLFYKDTRF